MANQTNLLPLNAAVEAVKAGEHGRCQKVGKTSKMAADEIASILYDIRSRSNPNSQRAGASKQIGFECEPDVCSNVS
ncbi:methyl-accepting chemotaxis protein [Paenibacillus alkalitolerans]|uniref:methyl-accepting chemotaxis protein n=1 Tax=Paenibacillus alkalitolerans TaxID=2799335 RepID=UPI002D800E0F|nr:methyl-accepting chemotaxis protein [Paenibacillus alkalitolerans]